MYIAYFRFEEFWQACMDILHPTAATEERRASGTMFASEVLSISDLVRRASEIVTQKKLPETGTLQKISSYHLSPR